MRVVPLGISDCEQLALHLDRNARQSGKLGIEYAVLEASDLPSLSELEDQIKLGLQRSIHEPGWARYWGLSSVHKKLGGHLYLKGSAFRSSSHRCRLGMGIEPEFRGKGFGKLLLTKALAWLEEQATIDWVELYAFEHNEPAIKLYEKFGFRKVGLVEDLFRINGQSVNDIIMTLRIK